MIDSFRIGELAVEPRRNCVSWPDGDVSIEPKVMNVLVFLAERETEVVAKDELVRAVWGDTIVSDDALVRCISSLRKVLRDAPKEQRIIQTISKRGYRLVGPVTWNVTANRLNGGRRQSALDLDDILAACSDHVYVYDADHRYLCASDAGARALGLTREEMTGKSWRELGMPAAIMEPFHRKVKTVFLECRSLREEVAYPTIHGNRFYEYILDPIRDVHGCATAVMAVVRDITSIRQSPQNTDGAPARG